MCGKEYERMNETLRTVLSVIQVLLSITLIVVVMLQSGKSAGLSGALSGGADTFLSKNKSKTLDARLAKMTTWVAILFMILTITLSLT